ncbi:MAG: hypothetical protein Q8L48_23370 [Archangium sp.]|nr:hypothetical protein [Archangium sp.]
MRTSRPMVLRGLLVAVIAAGVVLAACGAPGPATEEQICGPQGCDGCVGLTCGRSADGGVR